MATTVLDIVKDLYNSLESQRDTKLKDFLEEQCRLAPGTIKGLFDGTETKFPTKKKLAKGFSSLPECGTIEPEWFDASSVAEFHKLREAHKSAVTKIEIEVPLVADSTLLGKIAGFYVIYRYAFDISNGGTEVSRELVVLESDGKRLKFTVYYRVTGEDEKTDPLVYEGTASVVGGSVMAIGVSTAPRLSDRQPVARVRCLLFPHTVQKEKPENDRDLKFGILTSTRIEEHEPCSACIVMFRVNDPIKNLKEYCDKIAVVRQWEDFKDSDFGQFKEKTWIHNAMEILMKNVPRHDDCYEDKVLRLHLGRFKTIRSKILHETRTTKGLRAPWTFNGMRYLMRQDDGDREECA